MRVDEIGCRGARDRLRAWDRGGCRIYVGLVFHSSSERYHILATPYLVACHRKDAPVCADTLSGSQRGSTASLSVAREINGGIRHPSGRLPAERSYDP